MHFGPSCWPRPLRGPDGVGNLSIEATDANPELISVTVQEHKTVENRRHSDLRPDDQSAEVERAVALGARQIDVGQKKEATWVVFADPESSEFCVLRAKRHDEA